MLLICSTYNDIINNDVLYIPGMTILLHYQSYTSTTTYVQIEETSEDVVDSGRTRHSDQDKTQWSMQDTVIKTRHIGEDKTQ